MPRALRVLSPRQRHGRATVDCVILDHEQRSGRKATVTGVGGLTIDIDLSEPVRLRNDDLIELDDGTLVEVVAAPEPLIEARATDVSVLARLAWHLGDRHVAVQFLPNRIRLRRDETIAALLASLGAKVTPIEAPFEPEGGAYAPAQAHDHHQHNHAHDHDHDHSHGQHKHEH